MYDDDDEKYAFRWLYALFGVATAVVFVAGFVVGALAT